MGTIRKDLMGNYAISPEQYFNFEEYQPNYYQNVDFWYGSNAWPRINDQRWFLDLEVPLVCIHNPVYYYQNCSRIFMLCPFTANVINDLAKKKLAYRTFYPTHKSFAISGNPIKTNDVIYTGHWMNNGMFPHMLETISKFKYIHVSLARDKTATHLNISQEEKFRLIASSKVNICHNIVAVDESYVTNTKNQPYSDINRCYERIDSLYIFPQLKGRIFEAALSKTIPLVRRDPWSEETVEHYFTPGKEFIYWEDDSLESTLQEVLGNYEKYVYIAENAYERAINSYTTEHWFNHFLK